MKNKNTNSTSYVFVPVPVKKNEEPATNPTTQYVVNVIGWTISLLFFGAVAKFLGTYIVG